MKKQSKFKKFQKHVRRNKVGYIFGGLFVGAMALNFRNSKVFSDFLIEKGINPLEFFNPEMLAEQVAEKAVEATKEII